MDETVINILEGNHSKGTIVFGSDHAGFEYKEFLKKAAHDMGYTIMDCGTHSTDRVDYPNFISPVVKEVLAGARGVLICGSGIGMSIGANRFKGIRAALCFDGLMAKFARTHNNANILVLGERFIGKELALSCLETFLTTTFLGNRHMLRVQKLDTLDIF